MRLSVTRHTVAALLLLGAALIGPGVWVAEARTAPARERTTGKPGALLPWLWDQLSAFWDEEGSAIDPFGGHTTSPGEGEPPQTDDQELGPDLELPEKR